MTEWKKVKVQNCADVNMENIQPTMLNLEYINYYDIGSVGAGVVDSVCKVSTKEAPSRARRVIHNGDTIVSMVRPGNKAFYYFSKCYLEDIASTGFAVITPKQKFVDSRFLYYSLTQSSFIGYLVQNEKGATYPAVDEKIILNGDILLPTLPVQRKIAGILSAYDDLIENNRRQIKLLEEAARRLYKEWFVDLRFPGHEQTEMVDGLPAGWERKKLGEIILKIPKTIKVKTSDYLEHGKIPVIDQSREYIAGYTDDVKCVIDLKCPVIVFGDHTRILKYIQIPFACGADGTQLIVSNKKNMPQSLLYNALLSVDLSNYHYARHFKYLKEKMLLIPSNEVAIMYDNEVSVIYGKLKTLQTEINLLQEARDRLLPKLMSGEIEVE